MLLKKYKAIHKVNALDFKNVVPEFFLYSFSTLDGIKPIL